MSDRYRVGQHWGVTIVEVGAGPADQDGRRAGDRLAAVAMTPEDARRICAALNAAEES